MISYSFLLRSNIFMTTDKKEEMFKCPKIHFMKQPKKPFKIFTDFLQYKTRKEMHKNKLKIFFLSNDDII